MNIRSIVSLYVSVHARYVRDNVSLKERDRLGSNEAVAAEMGTAVFLGRSYFKDRSGIVVTHDRETVSFIYGVTLYSKAYLCTSKDGTLF